MVEIPPTTSEEPTHLGMFRSSSFSIFTVQEAWEHGNIARPHMSLSDQREYNFLWPTLQCRDCCFPHREAGIQAGDDHYISLITHSTNWYDGIFDSLFVQLAAHYAHSTCALGKEHGNPQPDVLPLLIHVTYPKHTLVEGQYKALP
jgi:hypothetical protein